jgi:hypothetical protein
VAHSETIALAGRHPNLRCVVALVDQFPGAGGVLVGRTALAASSLIPGVVSDAAVTMPVATGTGPHSPRPDSEGGSSGTWANLIASNQDVQSRPAVAGNFFAPLRRRLAPRHIIFDGHLPGCRLRERCPRQGRFMPRLRLRCEKCRDQPGPPGWPSHPSSPPSCRSLGRTWSVRRSYGLGDMRRVKDRWKELVKGLATTIAARSSAPVAA